jgi:hypothetical protein
MLQLAPVTNSEVFFTPLPPCPAAETKLAARDAAELVADKKPLYLSLKAGEEGAHFMLIEMKRAL